MKIMACRRCGNEYEEGGDGFNGFCPECADHLFSRLCEICGEPVAWVGRHLHHVTDEGLLDFAADAAHAAVNHN